MIKDVFHLIGHGISPQFFNPNLIRGKKHDEIFFQLLHGFIFLELVRILSIVLDKRTYFEISVNY